MGLWGHLFFYVHRLGLDFDSHGPVLLVLNLSTRLGSWFESDGLGGVLNHIWAELFSVMGYGFKWTSTGLDLFLEKYGPVSSFILGLPK